MAILMTTVPEKENKADLEMLFKNIDFLQKNQEKILNNSEYYNIHVQGVGISAMYTGNTKLFLGDLLRLWNKSLWEINGRYYYHVGGSPLSGMSFCRYWEKDKGFQVAKSNPSFGTLAFPAFRMLHDISDDEKNIGIPAFPPHRKKSDFTIGDLIKNLSGGC